MASAVLNRAMTENQLMDAIVEAAKLHSWKVAHFRPALTAKSWRTPMQGDPGFPDLVLARNGRVLFLELKSHGGRVSPDQMAWLAELGPDASLVWPDDLDDLLRRLR